MQIIFFITTTTSFNIATKLINNLDEIYKFTIFRDNEDIYHYFRTTTDNRLIMGGEDIGFYPNIDDEKQCQNCYDLLEQKFKQLFPQCNIEIVYKYCGTFISTRDNLGFVGSNLKHKNLLYSLGYGVNCILFTILDYRGSL